MSFFFRLRARAFANVWERKSTHSLNFLRCLLSNSERSMIFAAGGGAGLGAHSPTMMRSAVALRSSFAGRSCVPLIDSSERSIMVLRRVPAS